MSETLKNKIEEAYEAANMEIPKESDAEHEEVVEKKNWKATIVETYKKYEKPVKIVGGVVLTAGAIYIGKKLFCKKSAMAAPVLGDSDPLEALDALEAIDAADVEDTLVMLVETEVESTPELVTINF